MELHAYTRTISDLFSVKRKYVIPRFQREYSWTKEQVWELWDDIVSNIQFDSEGNFQHQEYFIGALVLMGDDKSDVLEIVDGQQRLTTITILLSVLCERFVQLKDDDLVDAIYNNYIAGKDDDGKDYFKLENETPKPFFQTRIQHKEKDNSQPGSSEEKILLSSYSELLNFTTKESLSRVFFERKEINDDQYKSLLKEIRDQVVKYLKVIFITVTEEEEAYTIFETLNARGMNLSFVDLIKNKLFKELSSTHPDDTAKTTWNNIRKIISSRDSVGSMETFIRHWWIAKYTHASAENVYKAFKKLYKKGEIDPQSIIQQLHNDAKIYIVVSSPIVEDFKEQELKPIYNSLSAFKVFGITQQRPFLLSLFKARERKVLKLSDQKDILIFLERFHFIFNAVCSLRPSGVASSYSKAARSLEASTNRTEAIEALKSLEQSLSGRIPEESTFIDKFKSLRFYDGFTKDKKLIQYIFSSIEESLLPTDEFAPENISLEHITPQSDSDKENNGMVGNLLPLSQKLNGDAGNNSIEDKIKVYKESEFNLPNKFADSYNGKWDASLIEERTITLAEQCYQTVWKI